MGDINILLSIRCSSDFHLIGRFYSLVISLEAPSDPHCQSLTKISTNVPENSVDVKEALGNCDSQLENQLP